MTDDREAQPGGAPASLARRPLRVALDARMRDHSGIGTYVRRLLAAFEAMPSLEVVPLDASRGLTAPIYGLREQLAVPRAARALVPPPHVLHAPHYNAPLLWRGPLVVTVHDLIHIRMPEVARRRGASLYARLVLPRAVRRARAVICVSEQTRADLLAHVPDVEARVRVVPNGCDLAPPPEEAKRAALARLGLEAGYVFYVGNVRAHKNVDALVRAHAALPEGRRPPLVLAGADQMPPGWTAREAPGVRLLGRVDDADLPSLYAGAGVFAFPSLYEGFGLPPLEAMACGAPVVCSSAGSLREVAGDAALIFDPRDVGALREALLAVLSSPGRAEDLRRRGRERAKLFTWARSAEGTRAAYEVAASGGRA